MLCRGEKPHTVCSRSYGIVAQSTKQLLVEVHIGEAEDFLNCGTERSNLFQDEWEGKLILERSGVPHAERFSKTLQSYQLL